MWWALWVDFIESRVNLMITCHKYPNPNEHSTSVSHIRTQIMAGKLNALEGSLVLKPITMSGIETLGILDEIQALVSDHLQVVSYKWLSRNFLVSSNTAKRLLEEFVEKHGSGLEVVYALSGWLTSSPPSYNIRLVSGPKLAEAKQEFDGNCSVQVYSVQASIPKDPAALWNAEFVQAEELFKQPSLDNCLRDNSSIS
ncbi:hypothetical protein Patl1_04905 [Pistacia atlantica]|uniref:Uncharacterized protein n=1 Tax=Pistacia atlantica TaxID=434234 RepID=A0ACC1BQ07_9ROSI|nr:hypothetical protein Patl1_04905 [Pistacia atlantica]